MLRYIFEDMERFPDSSSDSDKSIPTARHHHKGIIIYLTLLEKMIASKERAMKEKENRKVDAINEGIDTIAEDQLV